MILSYLNKTNIFIALQYLFARKKQSILAIAGVILGVTTFIVLVNFMTGVNDFLDNAVFKGSPDIIITPETKNKNDNSFFGIKVKNFGDTNRIKAILAEHKNIDAYANQVSSSAILISEEEQLPGSLNGVFPIEENKMIKLDQRLISGNGFESLNTENTILLGVSLANRLKVKKGDQLKILLSNGRNTVVTVSGIFSFGITTIDNVRAYIHANVIRNMLNKPNLTSGIHIKLKDRDDTTLKQEIQKQVNQISVQDWKENNKTIVIGNKVRDILTWSVSFALLLVAGFGIYNILNSTVIHKRKDIAVLKTMGYAEEDIVSIFIIQSLIIGAIGSIFGVTFGYIISYMISNTALDTSDFIIVETYPINFNLAYYILGAGFGIITTIFAGYFPSRKASMVDPVIIIRGI